MKAWSITMNPNCKIVPLKTAKSIDKEMPTFCLPIKSSILLLAVFFLQCTYSFSFPSNPLLLGDAKFLTAAAGGSSSSAVKLTDPNPNSPSRSSSGLLMWAKQVKFPSLNSVSFSTNFTFSISPHKDVRFEFLLVSTDSPSKFSGESPFGFLQGSRVFGFEFDTFVDVEENVTKRAGVVFKRVQSVKVGSNLLNSGSKLVSWIDYDSSSKRVEVRLAKFGSVKPYDPLMAWSVDLGGMWKDGEVMMGLSSSSQKSLQSTVVYSWELQVRNIPKGLHSQPVNPSLLTDKGGVARDVPYWLHSQPVNPEVFPLESRNEEKTPQEKKGSSVTAFLSWLIFITGSGAFAALALWSLWAFITRNKEEAIPSKCLMHQGDVGYEKINLVVEDRSDDVKS